MFSIVQEDLHFPCNTPIEANKLLLFKLLVTVIIWTMTLKTNCIGGVEYLDKYYNYHYYYYYWINPHNHHPSNLNSILNLEYKHYPTNLTWNLLKILLSSGGMYRVYLVSFHLLWKGLLSDHALLHPQSFDLNLWLCTLIAWIDSSCLYPVEYIFKILLNTHVYIQVEQPIPPEVIFSIELRDHRHRSFPLTISLQKITPPPWSFQFLWKFAHSHLFCWLTRRLSYR